MSVPVYWYKEFWLEQINENGIESTAKASIHQKPEWDRACHKDEKKIILEKEIRPFAWVPVVTVESEDEDGFPTVISSKTLRLFTREKEESNNFIAILDIVREDDRDRVVSCKRLRLGDAITFFSIAEETKKMLFVGGSFVKKSQIPEECNTFLTSGRLLRCTKTIAAGEEIVLSATNDSEYKGYFDRIDLLVVSPTKKLGRISADSTGVKNSIKVEYADGTSEIVGQDAGYGFVYRDDAI